MAYQKIKNAIEHKLLEEWDDTARSLCEDLEIYTDDIILARQLLLFLVRNNMIMHTVCKNCGKKYSEHNLHS